MKYIGLIDDNENWAYEDREPIFHDAKRAAYLKLVWSSYKTESER